MWKRIVSGIVVCLSVIGIILVSMYSSGRISFADQPIRSVFEGTGTKDDPFRISSAEDLGRLRDYVNSGTSFGGKYFLQTSDIDLQNQEWIPIGIFNTGIYFSGVYDGGCHTISNLSISSAYPYKPANVGLFGMLAGTVENLGIESGSITGDCVGSIASHGTSGAVIFNCYNRASVSGNGRSGGICDNFGDGTVMNCINEGNVTGNGAYPIVSYTAADVIETDKDISLPPSFAGSYTYFPAEGNDLRSSLNAGLDVLVRAGLVNKSDVRYWR